MDTYFDPTELGIDSASLRAIKHDPLAMPHRGSIGQKTGGW